MIIYQDHLNLLFHIEWLFINPFPNLLFSVYNFNKKTHSVHMSKAEVDCSMNVPHLLPNLFGMMFYPTLTVMSFYEAF